MQERYGSYVLKSQGSIKYDSSVEGKFTVNQLKLTLDPFGDLSLIRHMGNELDEFIDMYYRPCIAALFGTNVGSSPDVEAKYFMAYGWLTHEACSKLSCLADNMRWNRNGSGCIGSLITGRTAPIYDDNDIACEKNGKINHQSMKTYCRTVNNGYDRLHHGLALFIDIVEEHIIGSEEYISDFGKLKKPVRKGRKRKSSMKG